MCRAALAAVMLAIAARGFQCVQRRVVQTRLLATPSQKSMASTFRAGLLYADNHVLCLNKPAGMLSQLDRTGDASVNEYALAWLGEERNTKFAAAVHRLDRPVSGCLLVAASSKAAKRLSKSLADGKVEKRYLAVVAPRGDGFRVGDARYFVDGLRTVDGGSSAKKVELMPLASLARQPSPADLASYAKKLKPGFKVASTRYEVLAAARGEALVAVTLQATGRRHQIRAALGQRGAAIVGDAKYGPRPSGTSARATTPAIAFHAASLVAPHPVADKPAIAVAAPIPDAWRDAHAPDLARAADAFLAEVAGPG